MRGRHVRAVPAAAAPRHVRAPAPDDVPPHHARARVAGGTPLVVALVLIVCGAAMFASMGLYQRAATSRARALVAEPSHLATTTVLRADDVRQCSAPPPSDPAAGVTRAVLDVPALALTAPVLSGTGDVQLNVGVGHLDGSAWPDQGGAVVLEAHDVTFFAHLADLHPGDTVTLTAPCRHWTYRVRDAAVVAAGAPIDASGSPHLVLVTCWPSDALFFTNQRYVVTADLVSAGLAAQALAAVPDLPHVRPAYLPGLVRSGLVSSGVTSSGQVTADLSAATVGIRLGRLHLDGGFDRTWTQSARAFEASRTSTQLTVEATRALREGGDGQSGDGQRQQDWVAIAPGVPLPSDLRGLVWSGPVDVNVHGSGTDVTGATVSGSASAGAGGMRRPVTLTMRVVDHVMSISAVD